MTTKRARRSTAEFVIPDGQAILQRRLAMGIQTQQRLEKVSFEHEVKMSEKAEKYRSVSLDGIKLAEQSKEVGVWVVQSLATVLNCKVDDLLPHYSLNDCHRDFAEWHGSHAAGDTLNFATIGLDLSNGWENIAAAIELSRGKHTHFQVLMLTSDPASLPVDAPEEVKAWAHGAGAHYQMIKKVLETFAPAKHVSMEFKQYNCVPTVHGMKVQYADLLPRYYISECGKRPGVLEVYEWGEGKYMISDNHATRTYHGYREIMNRFDEKFNSLWQSLPTSLAFDSEKPRN